VKITAEKATLFLQVKVKVHPITGLEGLEGE
jgi:hypothetical protein